MEDDISDPHIISEKQLENDDTHDEDGNKNEEPVHDNTIRKRISGKIKS